MWGPPPAYTLLSIGDGLVAQIPSLIVSLAAGLIVTKGGTVGAANEAVLQQLGRFPKALYMAACLLLGIGLLPGFPLGVFVAMAMMMAGLGLFMQRQAAAAERAETRSNADAETAASENARDDIAETLRLDDLRLELGSALVPLISSPEAALPGKIKSLRHLFARDFGFVLPAVRIKDEPSLSANSYAILVQGVQAARGEVRPRSMMVLYPGEAPLDLPGERTKDPTFGLEAVWVDGERAAEAETLGDWSSTPKAS